MIYVLLAEGFEEIEALTPVDVLRRAGLRLQTVGIGGRDIVGAHGICVRADILPAEANEKIDLLLLPGGMPGAENLDRSPDVEQLLARAIEEKARVAAICAAPFILGRRGLLSGRRAVCYPGFEHELIGAQVDPSLRVVTDGLFTTAVGMGAAGEFALELGRLLCGEEKAAQIAESAFIRS